MTVQIHKLFAEYYNRETTMKLNTLLNFAKPSSALYLPELMPSDANWWRWHDNNDYTKASFLCGCAGEQTMQMNVIGYIHDMDLFTVDKEYLRLRPIGYGTTYVLREWLSNTAFPQGVWSERDDVVKMFANNFSSDCEVNDGRQYLKAGEKPFAYNVEDLIEGDLVMLRVMQQQFPVMPQDNFQIDKVNWGAFSSVQWKKCNWRTFLELKEVTLLDETIDRCRIFFR